MSDHPLFRRPGRALSESRHLDRHSGGSYRFKITLPGTALFGGDRITIPLETHDVFEAAARARIIRMTLAKCGVLPFEEIPSGDNSEG